MTTPDTAPVPAASPDGAGPGERTHREPVEARLIATGTVLDSIVQARRERIDALRARFGHLRAEDLERSQRSFAAALRTRSGQDRSPQPALIMECKAASPSRGTIRSDYDPASLAAQYAPYAAAVSVLTEPDRFNGSFDDLAAVREVVDVPVLCKDFIVDEVQVLAARSLGADAVLLMLSVVPDDVYRELAELAEAARQLATAVPLPQGEGTSSSALDRGGQETGHHPRLPAFFGPYGGQFVPELLIPALDQLEDAFIDAQADPAFAAELETLMTRYLGRPTAVTELRNLPLEGNARILLKREDLVHGGAHKGNQVLGQALLAKRMGKRRIIAETGAGQHGTATAMVCALLGLDCTIYMGATDVVRQAPNVERMELMGATVVPVDSGAGTLKDAVNEALRDWTASFADTHYLLGTAAGPHPFPTIVREYHRVISREARAQVLGLTGRLPDSVIACVGGGSNAIGMFAEFIDDPGVELIGVEPAGEGLETSRHGAPINKGLVGILHGARSYLMRTSEGQVEESFSVSAGLDYPGVGPEHAWLSDTGRARYVGIGDDEAIEAFRLLSRHEGIIPAVESAHALAQALAMARQVPDGEEPPILLVCLSGRGDKDLDQVQARLGGSFSTDGAVDRASRMVEQMGKRTEYAGLNAARGTSPDAGPDEEF